MPERGDAAAVVVLIVEEGHQRIARVALAAAASGVYVRSPDDGNGGRGNYHSRGHRLSPGLNTAQE